MHSPVFGSLALVLLETGNTQNPLFNDAFQYYVQLNDSPYILQISI